MRMNAVDHLPNPGDPDYERARALTAEVLKDIGRDEPDSGYTEMAGCITRGDLGYVPTWIALGLLDKHLKG